MQAATQAEEPPGAVAADPVQAGLEGYEITGRLGQGGMGVVWRAVQQATQRPVALKMLSAGMFASDRARARFQREVELTAGLEHPHIARVYDSGIHHGVYFYAMELIDGVPLDAYVRSGKLSRKDILRLMHQVCLAVQYAHQKGVIHRDLKPGNILVSADGQPHVLDFGLAKLVGPEGGPAVSLEGAITGTPAYMSPEQAAGHLNKIDTRSDVYSLGVILFNLLTDSFPHDTTGSAMDIVRRICQQEPRRLRSIQPRADKELDALLGKALAKEPEQRYGTAGGLAADLDRYLNGQPLEAQPPTVGYLLGRWVRKNWLPLAVAAGVAISLLGMAGWSYVRVRQERNVAVAATADKEKQRAAAETARAEAVTARDAEAEQKREAERQKTRAVAINNFLVNILSSTAPTIGLGRDLTMREVLNGAAAELAASMKDQPLQKASIARTIGVMYSCLGLHREALDQSRLALDIWRAEHQGDHEDLVEGLLSLGQSLKTAGQWNEALPLLQDALAMNRRLPQGNASITAIALQDLAGLLRDMGRDAEALPLAREALEINRRLHAQDHATLVHSLRGLGVHLKELGRLDEAMATFQESLEMQRRMGNPAVAPTLLGIADCLHDMGRTKEAVPLARQALEQFRRTYPGDHSLVAISLLNLGGYLKKAGQIDEALPLLQQSVAMYRRLFKGDHPDLDNALSILGSCLHTMGRRSEALPLFQEALDMRRRLGMGDHREVLSALDDLACCLALMGRMEEALPYFQQGLAMQRRMRKGDHPSLVACMESLALCLRNLGRFDEAVELHRQGLDMRRRLITGDNKELADGLFNAGSTLLIALRADQALPLFQESLSMRQRLTEGDSRMLVLTMNNTAVCLSILGRIQEAMPLYQKSLEMCRRLNRSDHPEVAQLLGTFANCLCQLRRPQEALPHLKEALEMTQRLVGPSHPASRTRLAGYALALEACGRQEEADALWKQLPPVRVCVGQVMPGSMAAQLQFKEGDVIRQYAGRPVYSASALIARRDAEPPAAPPAELIADRDGQAMKFLLRPGKLGMVLKDVPASAPPTSKPAPASGPVQERP